MNKCSNNKYGKLLHGYELGLLDEDTSREFELHLYECEACLASIQKLGEASAHLRYDSLVHQTLTQLSVEDARASATGVKDDLPPLQRKSASLIRSALLIAAVITLMVLKPWNIRIDPAEEVQAFADKILVLDFTNVSDPQDVEQFGLIASDLLVTNLTESQDLRVVSRQQLKDLIRMIGLGDSSIMVGSEHAFQIADKASARWYLVGTIQQTVPHLIIKSQLVETASGNVIASQKVSGQSGQTVFELVDDLALQIRRDLSLSTGADGEVWQTALLTTNSAEAYRSYLEGIEAADKFMTSEATDCFEHALELDSSFAMAYYRLALLKSGDEQVDLLARAVRYSSEIGRRNYLYIRSQAAIADGNLDESLALLGNLIALSPDDKVALVTLANAELNAGRLQSAVSHLLRAIEVDPSFAGAYNSLSYAYSHQELLPEALSANYEYSRLAPNEPNPSDSRADIYLEHDSVQLAIQSYLTALSIKPGFEPSRSKLTRLYIIEGDLSSAGLFVENLMHEEDLTSQSYGRYLNAVIQLRQGRCRDALATLDQGIALDVEHGMRSELLVKRRVKAYVLAEIDSLLAGIQELDRCMVIHGTVRPDDRLSYYHYKVQLLAKAGRYDEAYQLARSLKNELTQEPWATLGYSYGLGSIELEKGNPDSAIILLSKANEVMIMYPTSFTLGLAYLQSDNSVDAIRVFESLQSKHGSDRILWSLWDIKTHYYLGQAYANLGNNREAIRHYQTFLSSWSIADCNLSMVQEAERDLWRLESTP